MTVPGFTAEVSLYDTNECYRLAGGIHGNTAVIPQGCGFLETLVCAQFAAGCTVLCLSVCADGDLADCAACVGICLPPVAAACKDCVVELIEDLIGSSGGGGGGGGGPIPCCPPSRPHCCGTCQPRPDGKGLFCDDVCIGPGMHCP